MAYDCLLPPLYHVGRFQLKMKTCPHVKPPLGCPKLRPSPTDAQPFTLNTSPRLHSCLYFCKARPFCVPSTDRTQQSRRCERLFSLSGWTTDSELRGRSSSYSSNSDGLAAGMGGPSGRTEARLWRWCPTGSRQLRVRSVRVWDDLRRMNRTIRTFPALQLLFVTT